MNNEKYMCPSCGFLSMEDAFDNFDICPICDWEDSGVQKFLPFTAGGPNKISLIETQKNILEKIPLHIKDYEGYVRYENWEPINVDDIQNKNEYFLEKWFYSEIIVPVWGDNMKKAFERAQKYNPTKY